VDGVRLDEVSRGLGIPPADAQDAAVDVREEEVRAIWERERVRTSREARARTSTVDLNVPFDGAAES